MKYSYKRVLLTVITMIFFNFSIMMAQNIINKIGGMGENDEIRVTDSASDGKVGIVTITPNETTTAPKAKKIPQKIVIHGHTRIDNYNWLREKDNPNVIAYLKEENEYSKSMMKHTEQLQKKLFDEMTNRLVNTDMSVSNKVNGYIYFRKYEKGKKYPIHYRRMEGKEKKEQILDISKLAKGYNYYKVSGKTISPDNLKMAFAVDTLGNKQCTIYFKDLSTGKMFEDYLPNARGRKVAWANDNRTIFYVILDSTFRPYKIMKHILGTSWTEDTVVHHEKDRAFNTGVFHSKSGTHIKIFSGSESSSEIKLLDTNHPNDDFQIMHPREKNHKYLSYQIEDKIFIQTNWDAPNGRIMHTHITELHKKFWKEVIPHRSDVKIESVLNFKNYLVVLERHEGLRKIRILNLKNTSEHYLNFDQE